MKIKMLSPMRPIEMIKMLRGIGIHPPWIKILQRYVLELENKVEAFQPVNAVDGDNADVCPKCGETEPVLSCENCGHKWT